MYPLLFIIMCALFALEEFVLIKPVSTIAESDPLSRKLELAALWVPAIGLALTGGTVRLFGALWIGGALNLLGVALCACGIGLRYWSRRELGRFFTIGVVSQDGHQVIRSGPYSVVRHPAYLAFILFYLGAPMIVGSWFGLVILSLPALLILVALIVVEDRKLEEKLGEAYSRYIADKPRLLPGLW